MKRLGGLPRGEELHRARVVDLLGELPEGGRAGELLDKLLLGGWRTVEMLGELLYGGGRREGEASGKVASDKGAGIGLSRLFRIPCSRLVSTHFQVKRIRL